MHELREKKTAKNSGNKKKFFIITSINSDLTPTLSSVAKEKDLTLALSSVAKEKDLTLALSSVEME